MLKVNGGQSARKQSCEENHDYTLVTNLKNFVDADHRLELVSVGDHSTAKEVCKVVKRWGTYGDVFWRLR